MNKKLNKKLLNLIALCSGITATVAVGIGGVIYSLRQEKNGGDEPVDQKVLPEEVYKINESTNELEGFNISAEPETDDWNNYWKQYEDYNTMLIPASVTKIKESAFTYFNNISTMASTIPIFISKLTFEKDSNLTEIGMTAFSFCSSLISVNFTNCSKLTAIGEFAFAGCYSIKDIKINNSKYHIANNLGNGKVVVEGDSWNSSSVAVGSLAYGDITFPSDLTTIESYAFTYSSITSANFSKCIELTTIKENAFTLCSSLTSAVNFTNCSKLTAIGEFAFAGCYSIKDIKINNSKYHIANNLGNGKVVVEGDSWNSSSVAVGSLAYGDITFPSDLTTIESYAFTYSSITSANFSKCIELTTIKESAFTLCSSLTSVTFPSNLATISNGAFQDCEALTNITWDGLSSDPSAAIKGSAFSGINSVGTVKVINAGGDPVYTSQQLLDWLVKNAGTTYFPTGDGTNWTAI